MKKLTWLFLAPLAAGLILTTACGETTDTPPADGGATDGGQDAGPPDCSSDTMIDISGVASVHPVSATLDPSLTMADVSFTLEDPVQVLAGRDGALKYADCTPATMDLTPNTGAESTANYAFTAVNTKPLALGLIATMDNVGASTTYIKTGMGLASGPQTANLVVQTPAFVVAASTEAAFAGLDGKLPGDLTTAGWIFGMFITPAGAPLDGVELVDNTGAAIPALYPNATFQGPEADGNTSVNGIFIVSGASLQEYAGNAPGGLTCATQNAATSAGTVFVVMLPCQ